MCSNVPYDSERCRIAGKFAGDPSARVILSGGFVPDYFVSFKLKMQRTEGGKQRKRKDKKGQ